MLPITLEDGEKLIAVQEIVYAFQSTIGTELITVSTPEKSIKILEDVSVVRAAGLASVISNGLRYAVNPVHCREILPTIGGRAIIVTRRGRIETESYEDTVIAFAAVAASSTVPGPYDGSTAAGAAGVPLGGQYRLSQINDYDLPSPGGMLVVVRI